MSFMLRLLRLRYLLFGTAVGGGIAIHNKYENFKNNMPDISWLKEYLSEESYNKFHESMKNIYDTIHPPNLDPIKNSFYNMRERAGRLFTIKTIDEIMQEEEDEKRQQGAVAADDSDSQVKRESRNKRVPLTAKQLTDKERIIRLQEEVMSIQLKYQKELEKIEKDNIELKRQLLLQKEKLRGSKIRRIKRSLIDMYSEVLDELAQYDSEYNISDNLPRVVVIGDQSAGKTSVLEMLVQARIFPRGAGEMMTKSPVKVTLSEGPYHVAQFRGSTREYDLTKESELAELRHEIEVRMKSALKDNQTVSNEVISLSVKGPGLQRMILVDLPGIISSETQGMAEQTKESISKLATSYMSNPNAIILCIQDGSIDAERSNVTDLVSKMDPYGKRTIFVLTKVDIAESNSFNPDRMKKILDGKLFPMKARGYFAVITGKSNNTNDTIESIKAYEEAFFAKSKLFREGILLPNQMTTRNLSMAVSDCFWRMVKESVEQQADIFKASRFNLETEWKNTYPKLRELVRDELYEKARNEILDQIINLGQIRSKEWEDALNKLLLNESSSYIFSNIYVPAAQTDSYGSFNTAADIKLRNWADKHLPQKCIEVGTKALLQEFENLIAKEKSKKNHDTLLDDIKQAILEIASTHHKWDEKAADSLRVIQTNALEDRTVPDRQSWNSAVEFMEGLIKARLTQINDELKDMKGPGFSERWLKWKYATDEQYARSATVDELERLRKTFNVTLKQRLDFAEVTTVKKNLEAQRIQVDEKFIKDTWSCVYKKHFLEQRLDVCTECRNFFHYYQKGFTDHGFDCNEIILFWRLKRMFNITANALRQQIVNIEIRRLEREIKEILDEHAQDTSFKKKMLKGKRVELAEELNRVRQIQEKLDEFIQTLNNDKN